MKSHSFLMTFDVDDDVPADDIEEYLTHAISVTIDHHPVGNFIQHLETESIDETAVLNLYHLQEVSK